MINVTSDPENRHSKDYNYVVLNLIDVFYYLTKSDLSCDDWRMMWNMMSDRIIEYHKVVQNRPKSRFWVRQCHVQSRRRAGKPAT